MAEPEAIAEGSPARVVVLCHTSQSYLTAWAATGECVVGLDTT